ncbi:MAG: TetR/AcrR family transcriptional regulator [Christensenellaceae bacterium]|jgi:AcrR family transcriptional regulator
MEQMKDKIALHAREQFDKHGYHGTGLRDICKLSGCKMPTLYYYYENKETLYDRIVGEAFTELVPRLWEQLPADADAKEYAAQMVIQKKHLTEDERLIYRLAMKTWLGFEDCGPCRQRLLDWEQSEYENSWQRYHNIVGSKQWAKFISRAITALILRIILLDECIPDDEIRTEINMIFDVAAHSK